MKLSVIIPTYNEAANIVQTLKSLYVEGMEIEYIVVDGGSTDDTVEKARQSGAQVLLSPQKGRAFQMNFGAKHSKGEVLYFVHADTRVPDGYYKDIEKAVSEGCSGCFRYKFDSNRRILRLQTYFIRYNFSICRGGDQTLFVKRSCFEKLNGFDEKYVIMEDYDFIKRLKRICAFVILPKDAIVSARKYSTNSYVRVNFANLLVFSLYKLRVKPVRLKKIYGGLLRPY